jgi:hypothetical protein
MQVVIHIGTEKTGSTTLQEFILLNRDVLLVNGVYVPQCLGHSNHRKLVGYCMSDSNSDDFIIRNGLINKKKRDRFRKSVADALINELGELDQTLVDTVLISSEHFHSRLTDISEVEQLKVLFASIGADVKVICYLRKQSYLLESKYSTFLKYHEPNDSFASFSKECVESNQYYNYDLFLKLWEQCFSVENIRIREFSRNKFKENNLCLDFLDFAGLNVEEKELNFPGDKNTSFSALGMFMMRVVNRVFIKKGKGRMSNKNRKRVVDFISNFFSGKKPRLMNFDERDIIDRHFDKCNAEVSSRYSIQLFSDVKSNR